MSRFKIFCISMLALCGMAHGANVLIVDTGSLGQTKTNLSVSQVSLGNTVTILGVNQLPGSLAGFSQVWDIGYNQPISPAYKAKLADYLQAGGSLFLMGENPGAAPTRNPAITSLLADLGAGPVTISGYGPGSETIDSRFLVNNPTAAVTFAGSGRFSNTGSGVCITSGCTAADWAPGTLSNAPLGHITSVLDVNFLDTGYLQASFTANVITNLDTYQVPEQPGLKSIPTVTEAGLLSISALLLLCGFFGISRRNSNS